MPKPRCLRPEHVDAPSSSQMLPPRERQQPGNAIERGRLAAARRAEQRDELAAADRSGHVTQGLSAPEAAARNDRARSSVESGMAERMARRLTPRRLERYCFDPCRRRPARPTCGRRRPARRHRAASRSDCPAIIFSYSGRPNSLIASWLSCGAIDERHVLHRRARDRNSPRRRCRPAASVVSRKSIRSSSTASFSSETPFGTHM